MADKLANIMLCLHGSTNIYEQRFEGRDVWRDRYGNIMYDENGEELFSPIDVDEYGSPISEQEPLLFTTTVSDIKEQIRSLTDKGYTMVNSEDYRRWISGEWNPTTPDRKSVV